MAAAGWAGRRGGCGPGAVWVGPALVSPPAPSAAQGALCDESLCFLPPSPFVLSFRGGWCDSPGVVTCWGGSASFHGRSVKGAEGKAGLGLRITIRRHWRCSAQREGARRAAALYCSSFCSRCLHIAWLQCISATFENGGPEEISRVLTLPRKSAVKGCE